MSCLRSKESDYNRQLTSEVHNGAACADVCTLCEQSGKIKYSHPKTWKDKTALQQLKIIEPQKLITPESCICQLCRDDVSKIISDPSYNPRWRKVKPDEQWCSIDKCSSEGKFKTKLVTSVCDLESILGTTVRQEAKTLLGPLPLCQEHYRQMYKTLNPSQFTFNCKTCNKRLHNLHSCRKCPNVQLIQKFLSAETTDFEGTISHDDQICYACYKAQLMIVKQIENPQTNTDLEVLIIDTKSDMPSADPGNVEEVILYAAKLIAIRVGEELLEQRAVLLPTAYDWFTHEVHLTIRNQIISASELNQLASPQWLRSQLSCVLKQHIAFFCKIKKYGTVLYRYGGDVFLSLNVALGQLRLNHQLHQRPMSTETKVPENKVNEPRLITKDACVYLNDKVHTYISDLIKQDALSVHDITTIDIDQCIKSIDPELWEAICLLTKPIKEEAKPNPIRRIRRFYCLCTLFCTNSTCSFPIHTLLTDIIECCGGSSRLIKLLNRLGVCASSETHRRYVQYQIEKLFENGPMTKYPTNTLTFFSLDNLDFIHSFARVYCGNQATSWHGTTVMASQPKPSKSLEGEIQRSHLMDKSVSSTEPFNTQQDNDQTNHSTREVASSGESICTSDQSFLHDQSDSHPQQDEGSAEIRLHTKRPRTRSAPAPVKSPARKKTRRMRTSTEGGTCRKNLFQLVPQSSQALVKATANNTTQCIQNFKLSDNDLKELTHMKELMCLYVVQKLAFNKLNKDGQAFVDLQSYVTLYDNLEGPEVSNIIYLDVFDQKADNKQTLLAIVNNLYEEFIVKEGHKWVMVEGDAKTYDILQCIKTEYREEMAWLFIFPGDWHIIKNYQEVLMKVYFDAGLKELAKASGYNPNSVGTNYKRTHHFLLEVWEAIRRHLLKLSSEKSADTSSVGILDYVALWLKSFPPSSSQEQCHRNLKEMTDDIRDKYAELLKELIQDTHNPTWKFWNQFIFKDCLAYISMYIAIRTGNWNLRMAAYKLMAPLFTAFDRFVYQQLIAQHIFDVNCFPPDLLKALKDGGFVVSLRGRTCHSIGVDEAHEMCINKDCKTCITKPSADYIQRVAKFLPVRSKAIKNFEKQVYTEREETDANNIKSLFTKHEAEKKQMNVESQEKKLASSQLNNTSDNILQHLFVSKKLTPEQEYDLVNFRVIGQEEFENRVNYYVLKNPSVQAPRRRKHLLTFSERKTTSKKVSDVEKERRLQLECWKKRVEYASKLGLPIKNAFEQCIELPRAIATIDALPVKGSKANATTVYEKRYREAAEMVILTSLPHGWAPDTVIVEGMFLINIQPWAGHTTLTDYANFLRKQHIDFYFRNGAKEVHIIFDDPGSLHVPNTPKQFECLRRDQHLKEDHSCMELSMDSQIPKNWRENILSCRKCKRRLVVLLSKFFMSTMSQNLAPNQKFVTAGGFEGIDRHKAYAVQRRGIPQCEPLLTCNAEETDTRLWLHVKHSAGLNKLVLSPDTDVYHIGLPLVANTDLKVLVKISPIGSKQTRFLDIQALIHAFENDPDLASLPRLSIPVIMEMVYVCTGCDYVSFFHGLGKASFMNALYRCAEFITADKHDIPGSLSDFDELSNEDGFLSFLRLVGCAYFIKHKSAFLPSYHTPLAYFNSFFKDGQSPRQHHFKWLDDLRDRIWGKIKYEEEMVPSSGALYRHWKRSYWIIDMWHQADKNDMILRPLQGNGWKITDQATLEIDWDSKEHVESVRHRVALLTKGCNCKTGCRTARRGCVKRNGKCGAGCNCQNCCNLPTPTISDDLVDMAIAERTSSNHDEEVADIMLTLFGEHSSFEDSSDQSDDEPMDNVTAASELHGNEESLVSSSDLEQSESEWTSS